MKHNEIQFKYAKNEQAFLKYFLTKYIFIVYGSKINCRNYEPESPGRL